MIELVISPASGCVQPSQVLNKVFLIKLIILQSEIVLFALFQGEGTDGYGHKQ